jgi:hypothetical protein
MREVPDSSGELVSGESPALVDKALEAFGDVIESRVRQLYL